MGLLINEARFLDTFNISNKIGATKNGGLHRLALSEEDKQMRDQYKKWMQEAGLSVRVDDFGNMYGRREGKMKDAPAIALGSHLDTQPTGGRYDGVLGVLSALEVIRVLNDHQYETDFPIEIINFTNEEGARFRPPMLGSGGLTGVFSKEQVYGTLDDDGISYEKALSTISYQGSERERIKQVRSYLELHIEQGPVLEQEAKNIGIVSGIQGMSWLHIDVRGATNHAGPTPMHVRKDAMAAAAAMIVKAHELPDSYSGLLTTVGKIDNYPNVVNVVPGQTTFKLDIRHPNDEVREAAMEAYEKQVQEIASNSGVQVTVESDWDSPAEHFSKPLQDAVEKACQSLGYSSHSLYSGPGHDAKYMNRIAPTTMIFVPSIDGISHNEQEFTPDADLIQGTNVLLQVVLRLAKKSEEVLI